MASTFQALRLRQLDKTLARWRPLAKTGPRPRDGWIREIRQALGMSGSAFGRRLGVTQPTVASIERSEQEGSISLNTLRKAAAALDCTLVYALVPAHRSLTAMLAERIKRFATRRVALTSHSMALERQTISEAEIRRQIEELVRQMTAHPPRNLWSDPE